MSQGSTNSATVRLPALPLLFYFTSVCVVPGVSAVARVFIIATDPTTASVLTRYVSSAIGVFNASSVTLLLASRCCWRHAIAGVTLFLASHCCWRHAVSGVMLLLAPLHLLAFMQLLAPC